MCSPIYLHLGNTKNQGGPNFCIQLYVHEKSGSPQFLHQCIEYYTQNFTVLQSVLKERLKLCLAQSEPTLCPDPEGRLDCPPAGRSAE